MALSGPQYRRALDGGIMTGEAHPSFPVPVVTPEIRIPLGESGMDVFPLALGGGEFGWEVGEQESSATLDAYRFVGGNFLHTADGYSSGRSEHIIGRWMQSRGARDEMVVATRIGTHPDNPGLGPINLVRAVEASLERLRTDRIDVLYLDAEGSTEPLEEVLATAEWLISAGKARALGAYGLTATALVEARVMCSAGYPRISVLDVPYNVLRQEKFDDDLKLVVTAQSIAVTPSHALEHGFLAGRHSNTRLVDGSVRQLQRASAANRRASRILRVLDKIAEARVVSRAAVAVAWLRSRRGVVSPIVNAVSPEDVRGLAPGAELDLNRAELSELARVSA